VALLASDNSTLAASLRSSDAPAPMR